MSDSSLPFVSIITVNFNGIFFLKILFDSIASLDYPQEKLQVIMVDNDSTDSSVSFVKNNYPMVEVLETNKNLGYAGGNNAGVKAAKGDYIAFINNDCEVGKGWLLSLINTVRKKEEENIKIGGAGSKVLFYFKYLPLKISIKGSSKKNSGIKESDGFYALIKGLRINTDNDDFLKGDIYGDDIYRKDIYGFANKSFKYLKGFDDFGRDQNKNIIRKIKDDALIWVPVIQSGRNMELDIWVSLSNPDMGIGISIEDENIIFSEDISDLSMSVKTSGEPDFKKLTMKISMDKYRHSRRMINSCGSMINKAFYAREISYECLDKKTDERPFEVFALPGSSFIINKRLVGEIGLFDEKFFTYYEDIDFFWRAALKGWRFFADPGSVARHFHCGTGEEWSYSFTYHVLRNRLLMIYRCCWFTGFMKNYFSFCAAAFISLVYGAAAKARRRNLLRPDIPIRIRIFFEFFILMASQLGKRVKIRIGSKVSDDAIKKWQQNF